VRFEPALNIDEKLIDEVLEVLEDTLQDVDNQMSVVTPEEDD
jgi:acetylornithine/succinyldiaminopimelate/putrescine aminotransferase